MGWFLAKKIFMHFITEIIFETGIQMEVEVCKGTRRRYWTGTGRYLDTEYHPLGWYSPDKDSNKYCIKRSQAVHDTIKIVSIYEWKIL